MVENGQQNFGKPEKTKPFSLERNGETLNDEQLPSALNEFYVSVNADIPTFDVNLLPAFLPAKDPFLSVQPYEVCVVCCYSECIYHTRQAEKSA